MPIHPHQSGRNEFPKIFEHGWDGLARHRRGGRDQRHYFGVRVFLQRQIDLVSEVCLLKQSAPGSAAMLCLSIFPQFGEDYPMHRIPPAMQGNRKNGSARSRLGYRNLPGGRLEGVLCSEFGTEAGSLEIRTSGEWACPNDFL